MSATDKLVEKNCKLAELRFLASQGAVNITPRGLTGNPLGSTSRSLARVNLIATRKSVLGHRV
jgi:hypothetical protein